MVDSNYSGYNSGNFYWNGRRVTKDRYNYELTRQQEAVLAQVNKLATDKATTAVNVGANWGQQEFGGLLRAVIPNVLDQYGSVNAQAALDFYNAQQDAWYQQNKPVADGLSRDATRGRGQRYAQARTKSAVAIAKDGSKYVAQLADDYKTAAKSEAVIGFAMKVRAKDGHAAGVSAMNNAITREVASYHRDTVLFNAALDPYVSRVQRVAQANACSFCRLMALGSTNGKVRTSSYAVHFHSHCHCTIQPLFQGDEPVRPDYYDQFESEYVQATSEWNGGSVSSSKQVLANWREIQKAKADGTYAVESKKRFEALGKSGKPEYLKWTGKTPATTVSIVHPDVPKQWWWQKAGGSDDVAGIKLSREIPLSQSSVSIPYSSKADSIEEAAKSTNPKYGDASGLYNSNCVRVVQAYELRRRGFDVTANEYSAYSQSNGIWLNGWRDPATNKSGWDLRIDAKTAKDAKKVLDGMPDGSRGATWFKYKGTSISHVLNWEKADGKLVWVDAQPGKVGADAVKDFGNISQLGVIRLDNLEPMANVLQYLDGLE